MVGRGEVTAYCGGGFERGILQPRRLVLSKTALGLAAVPTPPFKVHVFFLRTKSPTL